MSSFTDFRFGYPHAVYGSTILSMLINMLRIHKGAIELHKGTIEDLMEAKKLQHSLNLWAYTIDTSDPDDKCQFGFCGYIEVAGFSCHPSHSNFGSVHLPVFLLMVLSFFIDKLPPCLSKHLLGRLLSQALDLKLCKILSLFLKVFWHSTNLLFLLFCTLHGNSWERAAHF